MTIYADKVAGRLTGRFTVEVRSAGKRYRGRHNSHKEAVQDEKRVQALAAAGQPFTDCTTPPADAVVVHTLGSLVQTAQGVLWEGSAQADTNFSHLRTIAAILGPTASLDSINTLALDKLVKALKDPKIISPIIGRSLPSGMAKASINRYLVHFRTALTFARKRGMTSLSVNSEELGWPWQKEESGRLRWIEPEEEARIVSWFVDNAAQDMADLTYVAIRTGCRRNELVSAKLDQINGNRLHLWKTKSGKARTVPMDPPTLEKLTALLTPSAAVQMPTAQRIRVQWKKMAKALGFQDDKDFVFHCCRHTCATRLVEANINSAVIKE